MRGQVYGAASDRNQVSLIFKEMMTVIDRVSWMAERLNVRSFDKLIEDDETGSTYEALSSDARKAHGLNPSFVVCDEVAQWRGRDLYGNLVSGMDAREYLRKNIARATKYKFRQFRYIFFLKRNWLKRLNSPFTIQPYPKPHEGYALCAS